MQINTFTIEQADEAWRIDGGDGEARLLLLFGDPDAEAAAPLVQAVIDRFPGATVLGCSTAGEIVGTSIHDKTISGAVVDFDHTRLASAHASVSGPVDSFTAGRTVAEALADPELRGVLVLSDGLAVNGSELVRGLASVIPDEVIVTGGLAGDADRFERTWVIHDGAPAPDQVTAVGLYGNAVQIGHGSQGGWDIFGPERTVSRSKGNVLYELDGRPALALYKEYLGELASGLPATALLFPLAVRGEDADGPQLTRTVLGIDEAKQSMTFAGDVPQGSRAQLMRANFDRLVGSASDAAALARMGVDSDSPVLSLAISCVGRRLILKERTEEELEAALELLPAGSAQVGFYSYGEISPYASGRCDLHNQTLTLTTLSERAA